MSVLAWLLVTLAFADLLRRARPNARPLPEPLNAADVPPYVLVCADPATLTGLEPPPRAVYDSVSAAREAGGPGALLVLGAGVTVAPDVVRRLAACPSDFISVFPIPIGRLTPEETWLRDFAGPAAVGDLQSPAGFADVRCVWMRADDLDLPGEGREPLLRAARARKAHGLSVLLLTGRSADGLALVRAPSESRAAFEAALPDRLLGDPLLRFLTGALPLFCTLLGLALLAPETTRMTAGLALFVGALARGLRALDQGFGLLSPITGLWLDPLLAARIFFDDQRPEPTPFPPVPTGPAPRLTGPQAALHGLDRRLDASAILHLARRFGGGASVMEQVYENRPSGRTGLGRLIDRWVHASPGARALRHRCLLVIEFARALKPQNLLSVPGGSGRDAALIGAPAVVLVDPDAVARALATARCPRAEVVNGTLETTPPGPFDVCLYVGLAEYVDDAEVVRHLVHLRARLTPGGAIITSTTAPHPDQVFMAERLGWRTRARKPETYASLLDAAGYRVEHRASDPHGIQWVFCARPIGQRG